MALASLEIDAKNCGARQIVSVQIEAETYSDIAELGWSGEVAKPYKIFSMSAIGTAICASSRSAANSIETVINLR